MTSSSLQFEVTYLLAMTLGGTSSGSLLPEWTDFGPHSLQLYQTHLCPSHPHYGLHPAMFSGNHSLFLVASITRC